jgi:hypothetical protein
MHIKYTRLNGNRSLAAATCGAGTAYPSGSPEFTTSFSGVRVDRSSGLCVCFVDRCLSFCTFSVVFIYVYWCKKTYQSSYQKS